MVPPQQQAQHEAYVPRTTPALSPTPPRPPHLPLLSRHIIHIISLTSIIPIIPIISIILLVRVDFGIPNHFWQEKHSVIAATIDGLGDKFKPGSRAAWLAYIRETYPDGPVAEADHMREGLLEIDD